MKTLFFFVITFLHLTFQNGFAADNINKLSDINEDFISIDSPEWPGPLKFVERMKKRGIKSCDFIKKVASKYQEENIFTIRVLLVASETDCSINESLVKKYLKHSDPVVVANAITLANSLAKRKRLGFKKEIIKLKKTSLDPLIQERAQDFLSSF